MIMCLCNIGLDITQYYSILHGLYNITLIILHEILGSIQFNNTELYKHYY